MFVHVKCLTHWTDEWGKKTREGLRVNGHFFPVEFCTESLFTFMKTELKNIVLHLQTSDQVHSVLHCWKSSHNPIIFHCVIKLRILFSLYSSLCIYSNGLRLFPGSSIFPPVSEGSTNSVLVPDIHPQEYDTILLVLFNWSKNGLRKTRETFFCPPA